MKSMPRQQRGITAVLVAVGILALLVMVGLAIDTGHLVLNKSRLQSTVDAAALAAAKVLDQTGSEAQATAAARSVFDLNAADHAELRSKISGAQITVQYSNALSPFTPGTTPANYVRVRADDFSMWTSFTALVGFDELSTGASAVAGPSAPFGLGKGGEACNIVPLGVCADIAAGADNDWGYTLEDVELLKIGSDAPSDFGPGNFHVLALGGTGGNVARDNLAGAYDGCINATGTVTTEPGNMPGPLEGLNTRFGVYHTGGLNRAEFPPDKITTEPNPRLGTDGTAIFLLDGQGKGKKGDTGTPVTSIDQLTYSYDDYAADIKRISNEAPGGLGRRVLAIPILDCTVQANGRKDMPVVGFGCFFLLQTVEQKGNKNFVFGEYIGQCAAGGTPGPDPDTGPVGGLGIYTIVLHNDPASPDS